MVGVCWFLLLLLFHCKLGGVWFISDVGLYLGLSALWIACVTFEENAEGVLSDFSLLSLLSRSAEDCEGSKGGRWQSTVGPGAVLIGPIGFLGTHSCKAGVSLEE